ncbi:MAG: SPOR domain-containing protein [Bacteroidota bacterium]|nr:SPOR domain-containing protein [Bacteroidota bacterium]
MRQLASNIQIFIMVLILNFSTQAQNGKVEITQSVEVEKVIEIKKEINKNKSMLRIQIFNGSREDANNTKEKFENIKVDSIIDMVYETPNYKIWVGNYKTQLEADIKLLEIKRYFPDAFIFRPILKPIIEKDEIKEN